MLQQATPVALLSHRKPSISVRIWPNPGCGVCLEELPVLRLLWAHELRVIGFRNWVAYVLKKCIVIFKGIWYHFGPLLGFCNFAITTDLYTEHGQPYVYLTLISCIYVYIQCNLKLYLLIFLKCWTNAIMSVTSYCSPFQWLVDY